MIKTVQEIIEDIMDAPNYNEYYIANVDDLDEIKRAYENEIAEKDKEIESAESRIESAYEKILIEKEKEIKDWEKEWEKLVCEKYDLQQTQLFKEDFETKFIEYNPTLVKEKYVLKDNLKYDKLPSKDVK